MSFVYSDGERKGTKRRKTRKKTKRRKKTRKNNKKQKGRKRRTKKAGMWRFVDKDGNTIARAGSALCNKEDLENADEKSMKQCETLENMSKKKKERVLHRLRMMAKRGYVAPVEDKTTQPGPLDGAMKKFDLMVRQGILKPPGSKLEHEAGSPTSVAESVASSQEFKSEKSSKHGGKRRRSRVKRGCRRGKLKNGASGKRLI